MNKIKAKNPVNSPEVNSFIIGAETVDQVCQNAELIIKASIPSKIMEEVTYLFDDMPEKLIDPSRWFK